jgi:hypothetical protein
MEKTDYIPKSDGKFLEWVVALFLYVRAHMIEWNITEVQLMPVDEQIAIYEAAYRRAEDPNRGKADVFAKNQARDTLKRTVRAFVKAWLAYNPAISDEDRERMALPVHKTTRTPAPVATIYPTFAINSGTIRRLLIDFFDPESRSKGKPFGQHGVEVAWGVFDLPQTVHLRDLTHSTFATHSPALFEFEDEQRGKTVYFALRWENTRGEKGPWSEIVSAIIP